MKTKTEWECIDLKCGHYDGDRCAIGEGLDPPTPQCPECGYKGEGLEFFKDGELVNCPNCDGCPNCGGDNER